MLNWQQVNLILEPGVVSMAAHQFVCSLCLDPNMDAVVVNYNCAKWTDQSQGHPSEVTFHCVVN